MHFLINSLIATCLISFTFACLGVAAVAVCMVEEYFDNRR